MTEWWRFGNIVEQQTTATRNKAVSMIDRLATEKLRQQRERESLGADINQARQERFARYVQSERKKKAMQEIEEANQRLLDDGIDYQIPVTDSVISQQLSSGRMYIDNLLTGIYADTEQARTEAMTKDAEEWAKWDYKATGGTWTDLNPTQKQEQIDTWFNKVATGDLPGATVAEAEEEAKEEQPEGIWQSLLASVENWGRGLVGAEPTPTGGLSQRDVKQVPEIPLMDETGQNVTLELSPIDFGLGEGIEWGLSKTGAADPINIGFSVNAETGDISVTSDFKTGVYNTQGKSVGGVDEEGNITLDPMFLLQVRGYYTRAYGGTVPVGVPETGLPVLDKINKWLHQPQVVGDKMLPSPAVQLGTSALIYTGLHMGVGGVNAMRNWLYTSQNVGRAYQYVTTKAGKPVVPKWVTGVAQTQSYRNYQRTAVYRDFSKWLNQSKTDVNSARARTVDQELFRAFNLAKYDNSPRAAQEILDRVRTAFYSTQKALVPYTGTQAPPPQPTAPPTQVVPPPTQAVGGVPAVTGAQVPAATQGVAPAVAGMRVPTAPIQGAAPAVATQSIATQINELNIQLGRRQESLERLKLFGAPDPTDKLAVKTHQSEVKAQEGQITFLQDSIRGFETTALAEGETGDIIPEGVMQVTGLEPIKAIKAIETQYATKKIQYEATKKALIDYAKEHLPLEARGKMLSLVKNVKTEADLTKAIAQADRYAEIAAQKTLKTQITKELSRITPKRQTTGYRYGRFTAETQKSLNQIKANAKLDREDVKSEILRNIQAAEDGKITFEQADEANEILAVSGQKGMTSSELAYTLGEVKSLKETGRGLRAAEREAEIERITKVREDVINTVTGGKGIKPGVGTIDTKDLWAREGKAKSFLTNWQYGMDDVLDKLSRFDKTSKPFQSPLSQLGFNLHTSRSIQQKGVVDWIDGKTASKVQEIYGVKGRSELNRFLGRLISEKIGLGTFTNTEGQKATLALSKDQIIQKYLEMQDPTLDETFRVGMKWTDEMMGAVKDSMTAEDLQYATWLSDQYVGSYGKTIKPAYEDKYHIPFPENPKYVPINRDLEGSHYEHVLTAQDNYRYAGVANNSLKARVRNRIPLRFNGATQVWVRHVIQMEHFKAFSKSMKEARMVFGNQDVQTAIKQYHGSDILKHINRHLDDVARDGVSGALIVNAVDKLRGHFTLAALGVKVAVSFKQALSLPAYLTYEPMPIGDFFTGVADFYKHPMANIKEMKSLSGYFSERWGRGHERDVRLVKEKDVAGRLSNAKNWRDLLMLGIHKVDTAVTQPGAWSIYTSMKKQGLSKQEAITHAEVATKRSQPSFGMEDMAALRKHGSFGKLFTMFQSQPNKYYRLIADNIRNLKAGRGDKKRQVLNVLLAWWVLPAMFQLVSDAFQWKEEHQARVAILGPANYLLAAGQLLQSAYGRITGEPYPAEITPVASTIRELEYALSGTLKLLEQGRDPLKDVDTDYLVRTIEHYAKGIGQIVGLPTPFIVQAERAIRNADIRQMVFSQYALKNEGDAVKSLQDTYAQAYGYNKWSDLPDEQKDRFWELRPDLK